MTTDYRNTLISLGAVPRAELAPQTAKEGTGHAPPGAAFGADVGGWVSPYQAHREQGETQEEASRRRARSLTYREYVGLLDVGEYKRTGNPDLMAVMTFVLERMLYEGTPIEDPGDLIVVYEAGVGLEEPALKLLAGQLDSASAMRLFGQRHDPRLLPLLPAPKASNRRYLDFLTSLAEDGGEPGWVALKLLYTMNEAAWSERYRDATIRLADQAGEWSRRAELYAALVEIGDKASTRFLADRLEGESVTEARETLLRAAAGRGVSDLVASVGRILDGAAGDHAPVSHSRMEGQWEASLRDYLESVAEDRRATRRGAARARKLLERMKR